MLSNLINHSNLDNLLEPTNLSIQLKLYKDILWSNWAATVSYSRNMIKLLKKEEVTRITQVINYNIFDLTCKSIMFNYDNYTRDINAVNFIASTKINTFLLEKSKTLIPLRNEGV